jgi:hypothetical protein
MVSKELYKEARESCILLKMGQDNNKRILMLNSVYIREIVDFKYLAARTLAALPITIYAQWVIHLEHSGSHILT